MKFDLKKFKIFQKYFVPGLPIEIKKCLEVSKEEVSPFSLNLYHLNDQCSNLEDKYRSERPITETNKANIELIESLKDINPRVLYSYLEEETLFLEVR